MNPIIFAIPVFMLTIVLEAWLAHRRGVAVYDIPDAITSLHHGVLSQVLGAFTKLGIYVLVYNSFRLTEWSTSNIALWVLALVFYDFCYYWAHRMGHEVNVMWASHVVHHSSEYYNLSTALRQTSSGGLFGWIFYLPMAVAGVPPMMLVVVGLIDLLYQYWVHTELIGRLGVLDRILVTPSNHRVHHGQNDYCIDKNYGGILILWDRLFGTFEDERDGEKIVYGIRKPLRSLNPVWGNLHYYADLWKESVAATGWRAKLGVWLAPPGGWRDGPIEHFEPGTFQRFDKKIPKALQWYGVLQYAALVPAVVLFLAGVGKVSTFDSALLALTIVVWSVVLGGVLEGYQWARRVECLRLLGLGAAFGLLPQSFGWDVPVAVRVAIAVFAVGSAAWMVLRGLQLPAPAEPTVSVGSAGAAA